MQYKQSKEIQKTKMLQFRNLNLPLSWHGKQLSPMLRTKDMKIKVLKTVLEKSWTGAITRKPRSLV